MRNTNCFHAFSFILLLAILTCIFKKMLQKFPESSILSCVVSTATQLKLAWDCLLGHSFCHDHHRATTVAVAGVLAPGAAGVRAFEGGSSPETAPECCVCLCGVEEGEEVRELGCGHVFHRACLDRWLGSGRMTCPLCRSHVKPAAGPLLQCHFLGEEAVVVVDFFSGRRRDGCMWWLR